MTKVREQFLGTTKSFDICCASYEFVSIGPKRLMQHQFVKKRQNFANKKRSWPSFRIIEFEKAQRTIFEGLKSLLTITLEVERSFL